MARLPYLDPPGEIAERIRARRGGALRPLDGILLHSPDAAAGWNELLGAVRGASSLPDDVRELVILRVAALNGAEYEWDAHEPIARRAGLDDDQVAHLRHPRSASPLTGPQQAAFDFTTSLTRECRVPDDVFATARGAFGEQGVVDLAIAVGAYNMVSRFLTALDVGERLDDEVAS
jgi:4-carboxymuconolactone decarboxylase